MANEIRLTGFSRVFTIDGRARPSEPPAYDGLAKAGAFSWPQGDVTLVRKPGDKYGSFKVVGKVPGDEGNPSLTLMRRYPTNLSRLFKLAKKKCDFDVQVHMGVCQDPRDFNRGWDKILFIDAARITTYGISDMGALEPSENAVVNEEVPIEGEDAVELVNITYAQKASVEIVREVVDVEICDTEACGDCGVPSDGCNIIFAIVRSSDASPGLPSEVVYSSDGGATWHDTVITSLSATEDPNDSDCVGSNLIVLSNESGSLHWAAIVDILAGTEVWAEVSTGFVGAPNAIHSISSVYTWIVGDGGYIYFTTDPTSGVTVQDAGSATAQNLNAVHAIDELNAAAVGDSNAVVVTNDGGLTWQAITGPAAGVNLNTVFMKSDREWLVGAANGNLYYTEDAGSNWSAKSFPGSGAGQVRHINFFNTSIGYMAHDTATPAGRILRTIDGGFSWYVTPEKSQYRIPANDRINKIAVCADPNIIFAGGLADDDTDGLLVAGAGA